MSALRLPGLDAQNPLGFFAALGLLRVIDIHARERDIELPRLSFSSDASPSAMLVTELTIDDVVGLVLEDAAAQANCALLQLAYTNEGESCSPSSGDAKRDLKPKPAHAREFLTAVARSPRRDADLAAGLFSELVQDNNGNTKPTALYFTAGQQAFLKMVDELRAGITADDVREALDGPWLSKSRLPSLSWDSSQSRLYALRATDPSSEKRGSVPSANWLAVQALAFFPVVVQRGRLVTTGVEGGWKDSVFTWPVWSVPITVPVVASLIRSDAGAWSARARAAMGVEMVFSSRILRSDQGGYGTFAPADVILPRIERARWWAR